MITATLYRPPLLSLSSLHGRKFEKFYGAYWHACNLTVGILDHKLIRITYGIRYSYGFIQMQNSIPMFRTLRIGDHIRLERHRIPFDAVLRGGPFRKDHIMGGTDYFTGNLESDPQARLVFPPNSIVGLRF